MIGRFPSPKELLLADKKAVQTHNELFAHPQARASIDAALLQYQRELLNIPPAATTYERIRGAQEFVSILMNLTLTAEVPKRQGGDNLSHQ